MANIAVVGAGIAGLACSRALLDAGHQVQVFEKSRGLGGRMATRRTAHGNFDHGAQYFTARDPVFQRLVRDWVAAGIAAPYAGSIVRLGAGVSQPLSGDEQRYVATPAMNSACRALAADMPVGLECTVIAVTPGENGWRLSWSDGGESGFDAVVLAVPAVQAIPLCTAVPTLAAQASAAIYSPCWAVLVRYAVPLPVKFDAAFVSDAVLGWVMRDASRPGRIPGERWVLHANAEWSERHLEDDAGSVAVDVVAAFHAAVGVTAAPEEAGAHRWRYALSQGLRSGCLWDARQRIGACGDWCADGRIEGAYLSGIRLAAILHGAL
jgi:renalase